MNKAADDEESPSHKIAPIINKLNENRSKLMSKFSELDKYKCGKVKHRSAYYVFRGAYFPSPQKLYIFIPYKINFWCIFWHDFGVHVDFLLVQLTAEQIRIVLNRMSISITQDQMAEILARLGFSTNLLINYSLFVEYFSNRSNSGLVHTILSDPNLK